MAENGASEKELKLLETIKEKDERIEQLEILNGSLQKKLRQFGVEAEPMRMETDVENRNENERKIMKGENNKVEENQPENRGDPEIESAVKVVGIELILLKILKNMKTRDLLKNGRLVSRKWRDFSTEILLKRKNLRVEFSSYVSGGEFFVPKSPQKLGELTAFLTDPKSFPCAHFIFDGNVKSDDAQGFLNQFGSRVKGLKLIGPQNLSCIQKLLVEQIPRLETLQLNGFVPEGSSVPGPHVFNLDMIFQIGQNHRVLLTKLFPEDSPSPQFPYLAFLKLRKGNTPGLVQEILNAAPNLQECFGIRTNEEIETLKSRIHVVKGLIIKPHRTQGTVILNDLDVSMPIFRQLRLIILDFSGAVALADPEMAPAFCTNISNILNASQGSLKKVKLTPYLNSHSFIQWPQLENVWKLTLSGDLTRDFASLLAPLENEVGVSRIFPNLHTIHLKKINLIKDENIPIFKNHPKISTVKSLKISEPKPQDLELFVPLFPNVKHVSLAGVQNFTDFAPIIWRIKGLKSLEVEFNCEGSEIDAGFTGMSRITCRFLRTYGRGEYEQEQVEEFRVWPSIVEATELEQLFLPRGFSESEEYNANPRRQEQQDLFIATCVSFKYAFNLMPKLRVFSHRDQ